MEDGSKKLNLVRVVLSSVVLAISISACQTTGNLSTSDGDETTSEFSESDRVSQAFYTPFYDQGDHIKSLVEKTEFDSAAKLYSEQSTFFSNPEKRKKYLPVLEAIANHYNDPIKEKITPVFETVNAVMVPLEQARWEDTREALNSAEFIIRNYPSNPIVDDPEFQLPTLATLKASTEKAKRLLKQNIDGAFKGYDLFGEPSFFATYPVTVDAKDTFSRNFDSISTKLDSASKEELIEFLNRYPAGTSLPIEIYDRASRAFKGHLITEQAASDAPKLAKILTVLRQLKDSGFKQNLEEEEKIGFIEVTSKTLLKEGQVEFPAEITPDFPINPVKADLDDALTDADGPNYLIILDVALAKASRRVVEKKAVPSKVQTGTIEKPNPQYQIVQNELSNSRLAVQQASMSKMSADSQFCQGWGCLGKAIGQIAAGARVGKAQETMKEAMSRLSATPITLTEPVYAKYKYDVASVKASKVMTVHYYIIDKVENSYFKSSFDIEEKKEFDVAYRVQDDDPDKSSIHSTNSTEEEVVAWEEAPSSIKFSLLVAHYTENVEQSKKIGTLVDLRREMLRDKNRALAKYQSERFDARPLNDPRFDHVVVVHTGDGNVGSGFFVKSDIVLTNWHVVGERKFVEMKSYDGQETFGKVLAKDARLDLALIKVQSRGKAVEFYSAKSINLGETVEAIGHPRKLEFSITRGVISALRKKTFTGGNEVLFVQTDAPLNPGNSGGPLFLGNKVIGVNTWKKRKSEGLNFSVHYSEVIKFIKTYLPAFQV